MKTQIRPTTPAAAVPDARTIGMSRHVRRVLFVEQCLSRGGIANHMIDLAEGLKETGWEVGFAVSPDADDSVPPDEVTARGIRLLPVPFTTQRLSFGLLDPASVRRRAASLLRHVREFRPSVLHVHWYPVSPYTALAAVKNRLPVVSSIHSQFAPACYLPEAPLIERLKRPLCRFGDRVIAPTKEIEAHATGSCRIDPGIIRKVPYGIDVERFRPPVPDERRSAQTRFGLDPSEHVFTVMARFVPEKGLGTVLQAVYLLKAAGTSCKCLLIGSGPLEETVIENARRLEVMDRIVFAGFTSGPPAYWATPILVLTSSIEGFPLTVAEAMACGAVPIRTPSGGAYDQISDGASGFIIPHNDPRALAERLQLLLENPQRRAEMAGVARKHIAANFRKDQMVARTAAVYEELIDEM